jgi:uncharacterized membrane-anchored protein
MRRRLAAVSLFALALAIVAPCAAQDSGGTMTAEEFEARLGYQTGSVSLKDGLATMNLPSSFRYLAPAGATRLLEQGWGNPPGSGEGVLGMLIPASTSPLSREGWGVVITFDEDGYVDDKGATEIDYSKLLAQMQEATEKANVERRKQGYHEVHLLGWAEPPSYNASTHKMYWAKELAFADTGAHTLNYNVRVLGRRGVLVLNAVGDMDQLDSIKPAMQQVLGFVEFNQGHRYADYLPGKDKAATYGVAGLVAGAVAAKAGLFKVLVAGLLAAKKLLIAAVVAVVAFVKRLLGRKPDSAASAPPAA